MEPRAKVSVASIVFNDSLKRDALIHFNPCNKESDVVDGWMNMKSKIRWMDAQDEK